MTTYTIIAYPESGTSREIKETLSPDALAGVCTMAEALFGPQAGNRIQIRDKSLRIVSCQPRRNETIIYEGEEVFDYTPDQPWNEFLDELGIQPTKRFTARLTGAYGNYLVQYGSQDFVKGLQVVCKLFPEEGCEDLSAFLRLPGQP